MKRPDQLKISRKSKIEEMQAILDAAVENGTARSLNSDEQARYDAMKAEVTALDAQITEAEEQEARSAEDNTSAQHQRSGNVQIVKKAAPYSVGKAIREYMRGGESALTGIEKEQHERLAKGIETTGLLVPYIGRSATVNDATTHATSIDVAIDPNLSILGYEPMWSQMGLTVIEGLQGTLKLGKKTHDVAGKYAEGAEVVAESNIPSYVIAAPERFGITDGFSKELLSQENPKVQAAIVADMIKGIDRGLTVEVYAVALAAAGEVATGAITEVGFNALMSAVDGQGAFAMDRASFFAAKAVAFDSGSGMRLATQVKNGFGKTWDGVDIFYSNLFADGTAKQYVVYGDWSELWLGFWGGLEILFDPYARKKQGEIEITINRLADAIVRNSGAFKRSPDLDATT